jgi:hypothetical protein
MPNGGQLTLEAGRAADGKAQILVSDTGSGIPNELQGQIFDSFLTGTTDGTGLGLSISKRILRAHDGNLELLESGQNGTVFKIILPLVAFIKLNFDIILLCIKGFAKFFPKFEKLSRGGVFIFRCSFDIKNVGGNSLFSGNSCKLNTESAFGNRLGNKMK